MTGDVSQLMTFCSYEPEAITAAADLLISIVAESLPQQAEVLRKALAQSPPHEPTARAASQVLPCLLQLLDASAQQHLQLQRKVQVMEELQQLNEELKRSLKFKDEFVSNVSQQLCTPLANIKTAIQLLQSPRIKDAQKSKYWNVLSSECDHQINLIDSLTELSGIEQPAREPEEHSIVLFDIVPGVVSTYQAVAHERGLMLAYTIPANLPSANFPAPALKQVLVKLIENGIQCTPAGGQIWVTATADSHYVQMEVRDTGIGIPQESLPKIFDRFYRVPRSKMEMTGVGLGLTIVQKLLLQHGGAISVRSQPGQGSTFTVLLPQVLLEKQS
jgi:signal transduction histidine kinase